MSKVTVVQDKIHARLSPSGSARWMKCSGSVRYVASLNIKEAPSKYAAEGTVAHEVHEKALLTGAKAKDYIGQKMTSDGFTFTVTKDMAEAVQISLDYISERIEDAESMGFRVELRVEVRSCLKYLGIPGLDGGTSDVILEVWDEDNLIEIEVVDYKHGAGVAVEARGNSQALQYALGAVHPLRDQCSPETSIRITIAQPRAMHRDGPIRTWETSADHLTKWETEVLVPKANRTHDHDAPLVPDKDACRFCPAAGQCPALYDKTQEVAIADFAEDKFPAPESMTADQKKIVLAHADMIRSFIVAVENQVKLEMDNGSGDYSEDYKLVHKTVHRRLTDEATDPDFSPLLEHIEFGELYENKIRSIGNIEKALKKRMQAKEVGKLMETLTWKPEPATVVAPINDKRRAVQPSITSDFTNLDD